MPTIRCALSYAALFLRTRSPPLPASTRLHPPAPACACLHPPALACACLRLPSGTQVDEFELFERLYRGVDAIAAEVAEHGTEVDKECLRKSRHRAG